MIITKEIIDSVLVENPTIDCPITFSEYNDEGVVLLESSITIDGIKYSGSMPLGSNTVATMIRLIQTCTYRKSVAILEKILHIKLEGNELNPNSQYYRDVKNISEIIKNDYKIDLSEKTYINQSILDEISRWYKLLGYLKDKKRDNPDIEDHINIDISQSEMYIIPKENIITYI